MENQNSKKIELAKIFSEGMMLQREKEIEIFGVANCSGKVDISVGDDKYNETIDAGKFKIKIGPLKAGGPYIFQLFFNGEQQYIFKDVMVGDIWLAGGQSNMKFHLEETIYWKRNKGPIDYPNIRYYDVPKILYDGCEYDANKQGRWLECNEENAGTFSGVAFFFAKEIQPEIGVPVGIVGCNWGGTSTSCWLPKDVAPIGDPIRAYWNVYEDALSKRDPVLAQEELATYNLKEADYQRRLKEAKEKYPDLLRHEIEEIIGKYPWPVPLTDKIFNRPSGLYHTMVETILPFGLKGILYYQGETECELKTVPIDIYTLILKALIKRWRLDFKDFTLPFILVQLPFYASTDAEGDNWPRVREIQRQVAESVDDTYLTVNLDCGLEKHIHPEWKEPVGKRLALKALGEVYHKPVQHQGPIYNSVIYESNRLYIQFDHVGTLAEGVEVKGFRLHVCGNNVDIMGYTYSQGVYLDIEHFLNTYNLKIHPGLNINDEKSIEKGGVELSYGWANAMEADFFNSDGLPAMPFRVSINVL
jgi:sialate O-acetylesterase